MVKCFSLAELAEYTDSGLKGDGTLCFDSIASVESAKTSDISYVRGGKYRHFLGITQAGCLILPPELVSEYNGNCLINSDPYLTYAKVAALFYPPDYPKTGIHPSAIIADDAVLGSDVCIGAHVVLEAGVVVGDGVTIGAGCVITTNSRIGHGSRLYPNVVLARNTRIGQRCIIHSGAVLGADGFGFAPNRGEWYKIPQAGCVVIGDDVEIGANTCIDRAALGETRIGNGVKLDNLIQVGHNVQIGDHTAIAGGTSIAGSAHIGTHCQIAGMCAIVGHLSIADHVIVTATSMVTHSITQPGVYSSGTSAIENRVWRKNTARFNHLDKLARRIGELERQLADLQGKENF